MSGGTELLDEILENTATAGMGSSEEHIVIGRDRYITVPDFLKKIAVQYDHNIETVTFDCPRYWDDIDLSTRDFKIYINYVRADNIPGSSLASAATIDDTDDTIMHFTWTIGKGTTMAHGPLIFLVCIKRVDSEGNEKNHWNSELNRDMYISEGLEPQGSIINDYPDIITQLLVRMDTTETTVETFTRSILEIVDNLRTDFDAAMDGTYAKEAGHAASADEAIHAVSADSAAEAAHAVNASTADEAGHASTADEATHANTADSATEANHAASADEATHATSADSATSATRATSADTASNAGHASTADEAAEAVYAKFTDDRITKLTIVLTESSFTANLGSSGYIANLLKDWGDGTRDTNRTHTYANAGTYTIKIFGVITIPSEWCGYNSSMSGHAPSSNLGPYLSAVEFGRGITSVGNYAFYNCENIHTIIIPEGNITINGYSFMSIKSLRTVRIFGSTVPNFNAGYDNWSYFGDTYNNTYKIIVDYHAFNTFKNATALANEKDHIYTYSLVNDIT